MKPMSNHALAWARSWSARLWARWQPDRDRAPGAGLDQADAGKTRASGGGTGGPVSDRGTGAQAVAECYKERFGFELKGRTARYGQEASGRTAAKSWRLGFRLLSQFPVRSTSLGKSHCGTCRCQRRREPHVGNCRRRGIAYRGPVGRLPHAGGWRIEHRDR